jgi:hypothetical protein
MSAVNDGYIRRELPDSRRRCAGFLHRSHQYFLLLSKESGTFYVDFSLKEHPIQ